MLLQLCSNQATSSSVMVWARRRCRTPMKTWSACLCTWGTRRQLTSGSMKRRLCLGAHMRRENTLQVRSDSILRGGLQGLFFWRLGTKFRSKLASFHQVGEAHLRQDMDPELQLLPGRRLEAPAAGADANRHQHLPQRPAARA